MIATTVFETWLFWPLWAFMWLILLLLLTLIQGTDRFTRWAGGSVMVMVAFLLMVMLHVKVILT